MIHAYCPVLAAEFDKKQMRNGAYKEGLLYSPMTSATLFTSAVASRAYLHVLARTVAGNAILIGTEDAQILANELAQMISTKAAVPQAGATASASGSTTLTSKPTTTDFVSLAAESGAFAGTVNGNTVTAQANVNGLRRYINGDPFASLSSSAAEDLLQHLTVAATFSLGQSSSPPAPTNGQATSGTPTDILTVLVPSNNVSFNGLSASIAVFRPYSPTSPGFNAAWSKALSESANSPASLADKIYGDYRNVVPKTQMAIFYTAHPALSAALETWKERAKVDESSGDFSRFLDDFSAYMKVLIETLESDPDFDQSVLNTSTDLDGLRDLRKRVLDEARGKPLLTFTYNYTTPDNEPATHNATAVVAYVWSKHDKGAQLTGNVAGSWFASLPAGANYGRVKDYQISGQFDQPLGKDPTAPRAIASVAGYGQYQYQPNVLNVTVANAVPGTNISVPDNSQVFTSTAGWLAVAQAKLVFNIGKGMMVPVAAKWSNKTDLLDDSNWKGQFGISYDLSALKSILLGKQE